MLELEAIYNHSLPAEVSHTVYCVISCRLSKSRSNLNHSSICIRVHVTLTVACLSISGLLWGEMLWFASRKTFLEDFLSREFLHNENFTNSTKYLVKIKYPFDSRRKTLLLSLSLLSLQRSLSERACICLGCVFRISFSASSTQLAAHRGV